MVSSNAFFARDDWAKEGRAAINLLEPSLAAPTSKRAMSSQERGPPPRRRESRPGNRKAATLSAEQLERKRANDRESQRSIRQRTKEHIEQLETQVSLLQTQVAEMRSRSERFEELLHRNAALENEVGRLKHQLAYQGHPGLAGSSEQAAPFRSGWHLDEGPGSAASSITAAGPMAPSSQFTRSPHPSSSKLPRTPSAMSVSSRSSHPHDWQQYTTTRSPSLGSTSEPEFPGRMESYMIDGHLQQGARLAPPPSIAVTTPHNNFGGIASPNQQSADTSFSHVYSVGQSQEQHPETLHSSPQQSIDHAAAPFHPSQRTLSLSMPSISAATLPASAQSYQTSAPPYQSPLPGQGDQPYPNIWGHQS